jgi:hypothetical protein
VTGVEPDAAAQIKKGRHTAALNPELIETSAIPNGMLPN